MIPTLVIDSTNCTTELCHLGRLYSTDKSPYNTKGHRHPYTPIYTMLFSQYVNKPIKFSEIGVAGGSSVAMWNMFFQKASLYFFDRDQNFLDYSKAHVDLKRNSFEIMDVRDVDSMKNGFDKIGGELDILLDDSSHNIDDQKLILHTCLPYVKSGGMIIIEDIDRNISNESYYNIIKDIENEFSFITFILTEHQNRYSPGYDNDKLLVLVKK